jgi:hypothetical protein
MRMFGRRTVVVASLAAAAAFGGGAAIAGTHGSSHSTKKPAKTQVPGSNVHYPCRHHGIAAAQL